MKTTYFLMDSVLESFNRQRAALAAEEALLQEKLNAVRDHMSRLDTAEASYRGMSLTLFKSLKPEAIAQMSGIKTHAQASKEKKPTIKQMVLVVLQGQDDGLLALEVLKRINERYDASYERTSLSPQLSRLMRSGQIHKRGKYWVLGPNSLDDSHSEGSGMD